MEGKKKKQNERKPTRKKKWRQKIKNKFKFDQ